MWPQRIRPTAPHATVRLEGGDISGRTDGTSPSTGVAAVPTPPEPACTRSSQRTGARAPTGDGGPDGFDQEVVLKFGKREDGLSGKSEPMWSLLESVLCPGGRSSVFAITDDDAPGNTRQREPPMDKTRLHDLCHPRVIDLRSSLYPEFTGGSPPSTGGPMGKHLSPLNLILITVAAVGCTTPSSPCEHRRRRGRLG